MRSQAAIKAAGIGVASRLSKEAICLQYDDTRLLCTHACKAAHWMCFASQRKDLTAELADVRCTARSWSALLLHA